MSKVYLAHAHEDNPFSNRLADDLQQAGVSLWYDRERLEIGEDMVQRMNEGLQDYDFFLVVWSRNASQSPWVEREINVALTKQIHERRRLIPLLLDDTPLLPLLQPLRHIDFRPSYDVGYRELRDALTEELAQGSRSAGVASAVDGPHVSLAPLQPRVQARMEMFRLRETLWGMILESALRWGGGFAGISIQSLLSLASLLRGQGPLEGAEGEARFQAMSDFEELCEQAFRDHSLPESTILEACAGAYRVLADLERWVSDHPERR
jgi:hypothetical protein